MSAHLTYLQAVVTGLVQGVTELFPVSSLGHNVLIPALIGGSWATDLNVSAKNSPYLAFIVGLHVATALAMILYFWRDWVRIVRGFFSSVRKRKATTADERLAWMIILGTIPVGIVGVALQKVFTSVFAKPELAALFLAINGVILLGSERMRRNREAAAGAVAVPARVGGPDPAGRPADGTMNRGGYPSQAPQGYPQQPPPGYPTQPPPGYSQRPPQGYSQQPPPGYPTQPPPGYPQQPPQGYPNQPPPGYPQQPPEGYSQQPHQQQWQGPQGPDQRPGRDDDWQRRQPRDPRDPQYQQPHGGRHGRGAHAGNPAGPQAGGYGGGPGAHAGPGAHRGPAGQQAPGGQHAPGGHRAPGRAGSGQPGSAQPGSAQPGGQPGSGQPGGRVPAGGSEVARAVAADRRLSTMGYGRAVLVGAAQILALFPGISRDGIVTVTGMWRGLRREDAVRYSFLLSAPVILAAGVLKATDLTGPVSAGIRGPILVGSLISFVGAYLSIRFLTKYFSEDKSLNPFGIYCLVAGLGALAYLALK